MKRRHNKAADSDDDIDDLPLKYVSSDHKKVLTIKELKMYSLHACEFCEQHFENRYDFLIHNAKHIIIPLIKMLPNPCAECGLYFVSEEERNEHISLKHKTIVKSESFHTNDSQTKISHRLQNEVDNVKKESNEDEWPLKLFIKQEKDIVKEDIVTIEITKEDIVKKEPENILQNFMMHCKVDVENFLPSKIYQSDDDCQIDDILDPSERNYKNPVASVGPSGASHRNKIDLKSFSYNNVIKNEAHNFEHSRANADYSEFSDLDEDPIVILAPVKIEVEIESAHDSVHFHDLMKPGIFYCRRCFKRFPNRFEVIVHEASHLVVSKTIPEDYKMTRKHFQSTVPPTSGSSKQVKICERCNKEISDEKLHAKSCYRLFCSACAKGFNNMFRLMVHEEKCNGEAVVNICDNCLYMKEKPKHITYWNIMKYNNCYEKKQCHWCGQLRKHMSQVTITTKKSLKDQICFEGEEKEENTGVSLKKAIEIFHSKKNGTNERGPGRAPKTLSNRERLKLIQQRLKSMKK